MTTTDFTSLAEQAMIFGYPIVAQYRSGIYSYALNPATPGYAPFNQFGIKTSLYTSEDRNWPAPNNDNLYATIVFDLRREPQVVHIPEIADRYYVAQLIDLATNNFYYIGSRSTGTAAGTYIFVPPDWNDLTQLPHNSATVIPSSTWFPFFFARVEVKHAEDAPAAAEVMQQIRIESLSAFLGQPKPAAPLPMNWPPPHDPKSCNPADFFANLAYLLPYQIFHPHEWELIRSFEALGLKPGQSFDWNALSEESRAAIQTGIEQGRQKIAMHFSTWQSINGWLFPPDQIGRTGNDYLQRALIAWGGIWANNPEEAVYTSTLVDENSAPLDGSKARYRLTFAAPPPVDFFWSVTVYEYPSLALAANPINRHSLGHIGDYQLESDGSFSFDIQHEQPDPARLANWLPVPAGTFLVTMRLYGPGGPILDKSWTPAPIKPVAEIEEIK